jgi:outer membrane protein TolC
MAQAVRIDPPKGVLGWLTRPYQKPEIPPPDLINSSRLDKLVEAGNLYLSVQDVIALALEDNLDIEIQRYGPVLSREILKRAEAGGILRDVGVGVSQGPSSVSLTGVNINVGGGTTSTEAGAGVSSSGGIITQLGPSLVNLDPSFTFTANYGHATSPESNTIITGTTALIDVTRGYQVQFGQNLPWGLAYSINYATSHNNFNSPDFSINPYTAGAINLTVTEPLLQGFGRAVNGRDILIARNNNKVADLQFRRQVITTISAVLNLYWDLVAFYQDVNAKKHELATSQQLYDDNKRQVQVGTLAAIEVTRAEAQLYSSQQDLLISQTNLLQQETVLKNALSKNGVASPTLAAVHVIPLGSIEIPKEDKIGSIDELVNAALSQRAEIQEYKINLDSDHKNLVGIKNGLKPSLNVFAVLTNNGLAGVAGGAFDPNAAALLGSYGGLLGQIFRRDYPSYSAGLSLNIPLRNRTAQADYVTTELQLRQSELQFQKAENQIRVDVQNAVIGLQQARIRYESAVKARILQRQTVDADRKKHNAGAATVFQVVEDQQSLASAESSETEALANYSHSRIAFDQAMGTTLEVNHVSIAEALSGHVDRESRLPATLPASEQPQ